MKRKRGISLYYILNVKDQVQGGGEGGGRDLKWGTIASYCCILW